MATQPRSSKKTDGLRPEERSRSSKKDKSALILEEPVLTEGERKFVELYAVKGLPVTRAAKEAGYKAHSAHTLLLNKESVVEAIRIAQYENAKVLRVSRNDVLKGMLEAVEMARTQEDPMAMIKGFSEVGKICGYYNHDKAVTLKVNGGKVGEDLKTLSTADLLALATGAKTVDDVLPKTIEGECTHEPA